jgi:hypothetical protein
MWLCEQGVASPWGLIGHVVSTDVPAQAVNGPSVDSVGEWDEGVQLVCALANGLGR